MNIVAKHRAVRYKYKLNPTFNINRNSSVGNALGCDPIVAGSNPLCAAFFQQSSLVDTRLKS